MGFPGPRGSRGEGMALARRARRPCLGAGGPGRDRSRARSRGGAVGGDGRGGRGRGVPGEGVGVRAVPRPPRPGPVERPKADRRIPASPPVLPPTGARSRAGGGSGLLSNRRMKVLLERNLHPEVLLIENCHLGSCCPKRSSRRR